MALLAPSPSVGERGTAALTATVRIRITVTLSLALSPQGRGNQAARRVDYALDSRLRGNDGGGKGVASATAKQFARYSFSMK